VPTYTAYDLPVAVAAELAWHPNIIGIKESSGKLERIRELIAATSGAPRRNATVTSTFSAVTRRMLMVQTEIAAVGNALLPLDALGGGEMLTSPAISAPTMKTRTRDVGFQVLYGSAQTLLAALQAGCSGGVVAAGAFAPQACAEIYMAWKDKDEALAQQKQERIVEAANLICGRLGVPGVKYACDVNGYYGGAPRLPLLPLTGEEKESALRVMANLPH
jgi:4-hydroxy-2-oxoglutarate aldolase